RVVVVVGGTVVVVVGGAVVVVVVVGSGASGGAGSSTYTRLGAGTGCLRRPGSKPRRAARFSTSGIGSIGAGSVNSVTGTSARARRMNACQMRAGWVPPVTRRTPLMPTSSLTVSGVLFS